MMSRPHFEHVGLTVGDLDRMVAFFTEMLGFELKARLQPIDPGAVAGITGIGSAVFLDGKLLPNTEFGHMEVRGKDAEDRASDRVREEKDLAWDQWGERVGEVIARLAFLLNPDLVIIGGGVSRKAEKFLPVVQGLVKVPVVPAQLQNQAGLIGAALVAAGGVTSK